jgi:DNA-binding transcriptional LysR family regulator
MEIEYLRSFVIVAQCGSLAEAARQLDLTGAAVAARIRALEEDLGIPLVERSGRAVKPTEAGLKILELAGSVLRDIRDLRTVANDGLHIGELRIGVFVSALTTVLPPVLRRVYTAYPALKVFVAPGASIDLCRRVTEGELDAAIVVEPQFAIAKNCEWQLLGEDLLVVLAPSRLARRGAHELLRTEPFIRYHRTVPAGQMVDRYLRAHGIRPHERLEVDGAMAIAALVDEGLGVSLLPDRPSQWTRGLAVARIALPAPVPVRPIGLLWSMKGPHAALAQAFLREAHAVFSGGVQPT